MTTNVQVIGPDAVGLKFAMVGIDFALHAFRSDHYGC